MEKRTALGFILGFIGGFINLLYALLAGYSLAASISGPDRGMFLPAPVVVAVILIVLPVVNFAGACICRNKPAVGKALMYVTGLILLILFADSLSGLLNGAPEMYTAGIPAFLIIFYAVMIAAQCLSVAAAALLSVPAVREQAPEYGGILEIFRRDMREEKQRNEFQAVHRLYDLPAEVSKAETVQETNTGPDDI